MPMTRSHFLRLAAALPVLRASPQSIATPASARPNLPMPKSGSLLAVSGGSPSRILLAQAPEFYWREIASGMRPAAVITPDRHTAFLCFAAHPGEDRWQSHLTTVDYANGCATTDFLYPGSLSGRGISMALSADGHWLYTLTGRERTGRRQMSSEGGLHPEMAIVYTFDVQKSQFLPLAAESPFEFSEGMAVIPGSTNRQAFVGPLAPGGFEFGLIKDNGSGIWPRIFGEKRDTRMAAGTFQVISSPDRTRFYCILPSGAVLRMADGATRMLTPGRGATDALPPDRLYGEATVSGDGRLLFLPSGPAQPSDSYRWRYIDRISVYRWPDLRKLREQNLQRPLKRIWASPDGTQLFATGVAYNQIAILDADTLWQERIIDLPSTSVESISVVP